jgi:hypothetical protein
MPIGDSGKGVESESKTSDTFIFKTLPATAKADSFNKFGVTGYALEDAEGNVLQEYITEEVLNTMTPLQMAEEISNFLPGPTAEELTITGDCNYKFAYNGWNWLIEKYGNLITTKDIRSALSMFSYSNQLTNIPFDINFDTTLTHSGGNMFKGSKITSVPRLINFKPSELPDVFSDCFYLREISYEAISNIDWSYMDNLTSQFSGDRSDTFHNCYSLRYFPMEFLKHGNHNPYPSYSIYYYTFYGCFALDEIIGLPVSIYKDMKLGTNLFSFTFQTCYRLKNVIFET